MSVVEEKEEKPFETTDEVIWLRRLNYVLMLEKTFGYAPPKVALLF